MTAIYGRNEEAYLPQTLQALKNQTTPPELILYIDDCSRDQSVEIALDAGCVVRRLTKKHANYIESGQIPKMAEIGNEYVKFFLETNPSYFMVLGADTQLTPRYVETILKRMRRFHLVISGGKIYGEPFDPRGGRGSGRIYAMDFWREHVGYHPFAYSWESYPLLVARALGYRMYCFPDVLAYVSRPTKNYHHTGYNLREHGFILPYVLCWCLKNRLNDRGFDWIDQLQKYFFCKTEWRDDRIVKYNRRVCLDFLLALPEKVTKFVREDH